LLRPFALSSLIDMFQPGAGLATAIKERMETRLFEDDKKEEWARFELLDILSGAEPGFALWADIFGGADVSSPLRSAWSTGGHPGASPLARAPRGAWCGSRGGMAER